MLLLFATLGMMVMVSANDLMALYIGLELLSLSLYVVAAFNRDNERSAEAGLKYFVLGALASGLLLYGASLVYGFAGTTNFDRHRRCAVRPGQGAAPGVIVGLVFVIVGLAFKISAVPFHMWTPDVYEGAPTPVTAFFAAAPKVAAIALFARVLGGPFGDLAGAVAAGDRADARWLSMVLGAFAAIGQEQHQAADGLFLDRPCRLRADRPGRRRRKPGMRGLLVYMAIYLLMNLGAFAVLVAMRRQGRAVERVDDLAGLARTDLGMAVWMAIFMFSMAGIPPLAGFFGKIYVFMAAVRCGAVDARHRRRAHLAWSRPSTTCASSR